MVEETTTNQTDENVLPDESELKFPEKEFLDKVAKAGGLDPEPPSLQEMAKATGLDPEPPRGSLLETLEKERIETSNGFVWTVTIKIRDAKGRTSIGVGACNSNEVTKLQEQDEKLHTQLSSLDDENVELFDRIVRATQQHDTHTAKTLSKELAEIRKNSRMLRDGMMPENVVLGLARERAMENALEEAEIYYAPRRSKTGNEPPLTDKEKKTLKEIESSVSAKYDIMQESKAIDLIQESKASSLIHELFPVTSELDKESLRDICKNIHYEKLSAECTVPEQGETYGEASAGLIWQFHNRLLPVKFVLKILAEQIITDEKQFIDFEDAKESVRFNLEDFTDSVRKLDDHPNFDTAKKGRHKTGFPHTDNTALLSPKMHKFVDRKTGKWRAREGSKNRMLGERILDGIVNSSTTRFIDQFFGRCDKKKSNSTNVTFVGACFEMGLVLANTNYEVTLTKRGLDFVRYDNPIFTKLRNAPYEGSSILSKDEVKFFMNEIVSQKRFDLERKIMKRILGSNPPLLVGTIVQILKDEQKIYLKNVVVEEEEKLQKNLEDYSQARAISTASRLVEMGLLEKGSTANETKGLPPRTTYEITSLGKEIYDKILSKN